MSKKKLLSEAQVKRFMGLAGINPLNEMSHYKMDDEKEAMEEADHMKKDDEKEAMEEGSYMKKDDEPLMEEEDMDMDDKAGDADVEMDEEDLADVKSALDTLQDKLGPLLDQAEGGDMDMDDEPDMDMDAGEEAPEAPDMDMEDDEDMDMEKELQEVDMELTEEEIVNEVARRVAKRIVEAKRAHKKMNEALGRKTTRRSK